MLPLRQVESQIDEILRGSNRLVLIAPTGSGKTTQVPQILLRSGVAKGQIVVLQPRRLATRLVAHRVAQEMGCEPGTLVGYQTRHDSQIGPGTRIRFITEGLLLRLRQTDPDLSGVGAIVLDEFHERNIAADLSLGLVRRLQECGRPDLKLIVMSATLDAELVGAYLNCPVLRASGRLYPVDVRHLPRRTTQPCWDTAAAALRQGLAHDSGGHILIFMPGVNEINRTLDACRRVVHSSGVQLFPLHASLTPSQQDAAVAPSGMRKVIVATNVAETSITIEGVTCVIDSGLARVHRYDPGRAINVLRVEPISRASADQRAGRAGRTGPGLCLRLWTEQDHLQVHVSHELPEVQRLELSEPLLALLAMGVDPRQFPWLDRPDEQAVQRGQSILHSLGALDDDGKLTETGRRMSEFPLHPRLSRMLLEAARRGCLRRALIWAAMIGDRDVALGGGKGLSQFEDPAEPPSDLAVRERAVAAAAQARFDPRHCDELGLHAHTCRQVQQTARQLERICGRIGLPIDAEGDTAELIRSLLVGFPDHLAMRLEAGRPHCAMAGRRRVVLDRDSVVRCAGLLVAVEMTDVGRADHSQTTLSLANGVEAEWLDPRRVTRRTLTQWNEQTCSVEEIDEQSYDGLILGRTVRDARPEAAAELLVERIMAGELKLPGWDEAVEQWIERTRCAGQWFPDRGLIRYEPDDLHVILHEIVSGASRLSQLRDAPCLPAVRNALNWDDQAFIERMAPATVQLPRGFRMKLTYAAGSPPRGRAKIQDLYGLEETPRVAAGRQPVLLEILGPNFRPLQVTQDLANFWATLYPALRNELRRRYPRHEWR